MPSIKLLGFSGIVPRVSPALLPDSAATVANNVKLQSGEIRPWRANQIEFTPLVENLQTIYKLRGTGATFSWLEFEQDVDVALGPVNDTSDFRVYYTGDGVPKKTNYALANNGTGPKPHSWLHMGVPAPVGAPTLSSTGGTSAEDRAYVYTYVSTFGAVKEESAPSPAQVVSSMATGATVTVGGFSAPPTENYNITHINIYRTLVGSETVSYVFVAQIPVAQSSYDDTKVSIDLGDPITSEEYFPPPSNLKGLVACSNGMLAGFFDNTLCICQPYIPHAWPVKFRYTVDSPIVGLGVFNNTIVICTQGNPVLLSGNHPSAMSQERLAMTQPCLSKKSIASDQRGVVYAGFDGLVAIGPGIQDVMTRDLYTRDEWQALNPATLTGKYYNGFYFGFYNAETRGGIILSRTDSPALTNYDFPAGPIFVDSRTGELFAQNVNDDIVYKLDSDEINNINYDWKSKLYITPQPYNMAALHVDADFRYMFDTTGLNQQREQIEAANQALFNSTEGSLLGDFNSHLVGAYMVNGSKLQDIPTFAESRSIRVFVYANGEQIFSAPVFSRDPIRLPAISKYDEWEFRFTGNSPMRSFAISTSVAELKGV